MGVEVEQELETASPQLLVVDDDRDFADSLAEVFEGHGYVVFVACSHSAALETARLRSPDVAIIDVKLGHVSGVDLLLPLRAACPDVQCIMMTGFAAMDSIIESFRREAVDYLYKPADLASLRATVERCVRTARLRREKAHALEALRRSEERFRQLADATNEAVVIHDGDSILETNAAFGALFGGPASSYTHSDVQTLWSPASRASYARLVASDEGATVELVGERRGGETFPAAVRVAFLPEAGEHVRVTVVTDLSARRRAEEQQRRMEAQLRQSQKMEAIGLLTGGIAHDFNNVLQGIIGNVSLARRGVKEARWDSIGAYIQEIDKEASYARDLVAQLLLYTRGGTVASELIQVEPVVSQTLSLLRSTLPRHAELASQLSRGVVIRANATQLQQVLMNLCINARDALPKSGGHITVAVSAEDVTGVCASCGADVVGRFVEISITDDGIGISPELVSRIFDPFFSTKEIGKGTGMGLAVAHGVAHEHGGHFLVSSRPGRTCFRLVFPMTPEGEVAESERESLVESSPGASRARLMVVDDEPIVSTYLTALFRDAGYDVTSFGDPQAALAAFNSDPDAWDLVITDQVMPGMLGDRLATLMLERRPELPIVLCSGYSEDTGPERARALGIGAFLEKPYDSDVAIETVQRLLRAKERRPAIRRS